MNIHGVSCLGNHVLLYLSKPLELLTKKTQPTILNIVLKTFTILNLTLHAHLFVCYHVNSRLSCYPAR